MYPAFIARLRPLACAVLLFCVPLLSAAEDPAPARLPSAGKHKTARTGHGASSKPVSLHAYAALVVDRESGEVLYAKHSNVVLSIASITKLMVAVVALESGVSLSEPISLTEQDALASRGRKRSRLRASAPLSRDELMRLMLMSSENKAAHAIARSHPGGIDEFIGLMNRKAQSLGMFDTRFADATGLSDRNVSTPQDLVLLVEEADRFPLIREYTTIERHRVANGRRKLTYANSNRLIHDPRWEITLQKTGTTTRAGKCVAMQATIAGRQVIMVLLNGRGTLPRVKDATALRRWMESEVFLNASVDRPDVHELMDAQR